jgi:dsRNA-specific ribonuclease
VSEASVEQRLEALDRALGVPFRDPELREASVTHRSFAFEHDLTITNERLEFLGDSVLGLVVTDLAYRMYPGMPEGDLAKLRAAIVNMTALADVARDLDLGAIVLLGKGEEQSGGRDKASILADALEAVFGAVYLDLGLGAARELIERCSSRGWRPTSGAKGTAITRRSSKSSRRRSSGRCPCIRSKTEVRTIRRSSRRPS